MEILWINYAEVSVENISLSASLLYGQKDGDELKGGVNHQFQVGHMSNPGLNINKGVQIKSRK